LVLVVLVAQMLKEVTEATPYFIPSHLLAVVVEVLETSHQTLVVLVVVVTILLVLLEQLDRVTQVAQVQETLNTHLVAVVVLAQ
jgi:hypothetical protein